MAVQQLNQEGKESGEVKWGCFWYPDFTSGLELFFCFNQNNPKNPTLFHWKGVRGKTVSWVQSIEKGTILKFKEGGTQELINRQLKSLLGWTQKGQNGTPFEPSKHCTIEKLEPNYKLSCNVTENSIAKTWTISKSIVDTPNMSMQGRV